MKKVLLMLFMLLIPVVCFGNIVIKEILLYSDFEVIHKTPSRIEEGKESWWVVGLRCPGTDSHIDPLEHGESAICPNGLKVTRYGDALECEMNLIEKAE